MQYDLDKVCDRKNTDCAKWDYVKPIFGHEDVLPLWVADMDFPAAQPIVEALKKRAEHPFYGYTQPGPAVIESVVQRIQIKFGWKIEPEWIVFTPGVIPALNIAVRTITRPGDEVVLQPPVYFPFFGAVTGSGCQIASNPLRLINGRYEMDFDDLKKKFGPREGMHSIPSRTRAIILCNPQNPVGRLWTREEQVKLGEIVISHGGLVIADEIHCEILFKGYKHTSFGSISEEFARNSIVCLSPSKTFSLAGLEVSSIIIANKKLREAFASMRAGLVPGPNLFGYAALEAAYRYGDEWLEQVLDYLQANLEFMRTYLENRIPRIKMIEPQGTYLVWLDCRALNMDDESLKIFMREKARVGFDDGHLFGQGGSGFERINIACPRVILEEALNRIEKAVKSLDR
ncbi:MAG TPA: MalY/PatB family protein [Dehalococcoidales bacterium]|nr:MalY/PatB family protein [Dehalococcoidales bacterium]